MSRIYAFLWAKSLRMPGLGGKPNLGNTCISKLLVQQPLPISLIVLFNMLKVIFSRKMLSLKDIGESFQLVYTV